MKKLVLLFLMILLGITIFADSQTIVINAHVMPQEPSFLMKASLSQDTGYVIGTLDTNKDIALENIDVFIKLYQTNRARIKGSYRLTVTAEPLFMDADNVTSIPSIVQIDKFAPTTDFTVTGDGADIVVNYVTGKPYQPYSGQAKAGEIATLKATWTAVDELAPGNYSSNVVMTVTTV